ncbi:MAG: gamma-glutamyl-gamma-aminobutyrate hydrolase family protein [Candidatus Aminicenantes bacterium]|nr:gamma-glutamyl-gamma-aminobutyrate hydrolase family protein [Candidatus Aminicenantes bacterium]
MKKLAILDNSLWPEIYDPVSHWTEFIKLPYKVFRAEDGQFPNLDEGFTHVILTGSEASIVNPPSWVEKEVEVVKKAVEEGLTVLGSCFGHQLLVLALAGSSHVRRAIRPEIGWIEVEIIKKDPLLGQKGKVWVFSSHYDEVCGLDEEEFQIIARSQDCEVQAFRLKGKNVWGIQAHPEINPRNARKLLAAMLEKNFAGRELIEKALSSAVRDSGWIKLISRHFSELDEV